MSYPPSDATDLLATIRRLTGVHDEVGDLTVTETADLVAAVKALDDALCFGCELPAPWYDACYYDSEEPPEPFRGVETIWSPLL